MERLIEAKDSVITLLNRIIEEIPVRDVTSIELVRWLASFGADHVVDALKGTAENIRVLVCNLEIVVKTTVPVQLAVTIGFEVLRDQLEQIDVLIHAFLHQSISAYWPQFFRKDSLTGPVA